MRAAVGVPQLVVDPLDHLVGERVAEQVGALVRLGAGVAHEIGEQPLDQPMLPDDALGPLAARLGEQRLLAHAALDEPICLEPLQHLAGRGPRHAQHLRDPRGQRRRAGAVRCVFPDGEGEEVDRLEVLVD